MTSRLLPAVCLTLALGATACGVGSTRRPGERSLRSRDPRRPRRLPRRRRPPRHAGKPRVTRRCHRFRTRPRPRPPILSSPRSWSGPAERSWSRLTRTRSISRRAIRRPATSRALEIDIAKRIAQEIFGGEIGEHVQFKTVTTKQKIEFPRDGKADLSISAISMTCERWEDVAFSSEYLTTRHKYLVQGESTIASKDDVAGKRVCVTKGSTSIGILDRINAAFRQQGRKPANRRTGRRSHRLSAPGSRRDRRRVSRPRHISHRHAGAEPGAASRRRRDAPALRDRRSRPSTPTSCSTSTPSSRSCAPRATRFRRVRRSRSSTRRGLSHEAPRGRPRLRHRCRARRLGLFDTLAWCTPRVARATTGRSCVDDHGCRANDHHARPEVRRHGKLIARSRERPRRTSTAIRRAAPSSSVSTRAPPAGASAIRALVTSTDSRSTLLRRISHEIFRDDQDHLTFKTLTTAQRIDAVQAGKVDMVASLLTATCARWKDVDFSTVYYDAHQDLLVNLDSPIHTVADLAGQHVCATRGSTSIANIAKVPRG